ncbi:MAG: metalloregulator ArsR/SmtB family transcription factor [Dehalococcoidia bacterium]|nr:metalloregulator ArsR/SmtB family transcription factor [Dehalococcoidia bacterium]
MDNDNQGMVLAALAEPTRRRVVELLSAGPRAAGQLAEETTVTAATMSKHLRVLRRSGLIEEQRQDQRDARLRIYCLRPEPFLALEGWLRQRLVFWGEQLESFKDYVERVQWGGT